ncbi:MAG: metallophosphoesterase [Polyangiales bacterium]
MRAPSIEHLKKVRQKLVEESGAFSDQRRGFAVRRFAGHGRHADEINHLRIAHLTDQHVGRVTPMSVQMKSTRLVNEATPDVVVISGDFVCHSQSYLEDLREVISSIDAPVFCVLGNHDHWAGPQEVRQVLLKAGAEVLDNANTIVELRGERLQIVGLDDAYTGNADREKALKGLKKGVATIGLSHIGEEANGLWDAGVPLVFSGHTHAGQITVAKIHEMSIGKLAGHRYVHGLYGSRVNDGAVYVGAGIGAAVVPLRIGERATREIAIFELGMRPGELDEDHQEQIAQPGRKPSDKTLERRKNAVNKRKQRRERKK